MNLKVKCLNFQIVVFRDVALDGPLSDHQLRRKKKPLKMDTVPSSKTLLSTYEKHLRRPSTKSNRVGYISLNFTRLRAQNA